jgi:hypothetical protein
MTRTVQHVRLVPQKAQRVPVAARKRDVMRTKVFLVASPHDFRFDGLPLENTITGEVPSFLTTAHGNDDR